MDDGYGSEYASSSYGVAIQLAITRTDCWWSYGSSTESLKSSINEYMFENGTSDVSHPIETGFGQLLMRG